MGDAGTMSGAMADVLTVTTAQAVTGAKTFNNQKIKLRNPADTFTGTMLNPRLTADANLEPAYSGIAGIVIYKDTQSFYVAKDLRFNSIISSNATPNTTFSDAITAAGVYGTIFIKGPETYTFVSGFTGLQPLYQQEIIMAHGARLNVPNGYTGSLFIFDGPTNNCAHCHLHGGLLSETGTPGQLWTAIEMISNATTQTFDDQITGTRVYAAKNGIKLGTTGTGWTNDNYFTNMYIENCTVGVLFEHASTFTPAQSGCNTNHFTNCVLQAGGSSTNGIKDVNGRRNMFTNCYVVDYTGADIGCNITANATNTQIIGGTVTALNFADLSPAGSESFIRDEYQGDVAKLRKTWSYEDSVAITAPSSPSTGTVREYTKTLDANNDGRFCKLRVNGAVVEVQVG